CRQSWAGAGAVFPGRAPGFSDPITCWARRRAAGAPLARLKMQAGHFGVNMIPNRCIGGAPPMRVAAKNLLTPEEYLAIERAAETKSEYCNGRMFDMAGAIRRHTLRVANATSLLRQALRGGR